LNASDEPARDERIYQAVRRHHHNLRGAADHLGLHFSTINVVAKCGAETASIRK